MKNNKDLKVKMTKKLLKKTNLLISNNSKGTFTLKSNNKSLFLFVCVIKEKPILDYVQVIRGNQPEYFEIISVKTNILLYICLYLKKAQTSSGFKRFIKPYLSIVSAIPTHEVDFFSQYAIIIKAFNTG